MRAWRTSRPVGFGVVVAFLAVQLFIPISRLGDHERAQRFGWQMFSVSVPTPEFSVVTSQGETEIVLADYMARARGDIDVLALLPEHLCNVVVGALAVNWQDGSHQC